MLISRKPNKPFTNEEIQAAKLIAEGFRRLRANAKAGTEASGEADSVPASQPAPVLQEPMKEPK